MYIDCTTFLKGSVQQLPCILGWYNPPCVRYIHVCLGAHGRFPGTQHEDKLHELLIILVRVTDIPQYMKLNVLTHINNATKYKYTVQLSFTNIDWPQCCLTCEAHDINPPGTPQWLFAHCNLSRFFLFTAACTNCRFFVYSFLVRAQLLHLLWAKELFYKLHYH